MRFFYIIDFWFLAQFLFTFFRTVNCAANGQSEKQCIRFSRKFLFCFPSIHNSSYYINQVNEGTRHKENTERLEWLQIHVDSAKNPALTLDEKLTFNSVTNLMGPRKFLHHGLLKKAKSNKEIVAFLCNDFLLLTYPANKTVGPQFSFEKHFDVKLKLYKKPILLDQISVLEQGPDTKRKSISGSGEGR